MFRFSGGSQTRTVLRTAAKRIPLARLAVHETEECRDSAFSLGDDTLRSVALRKMQEYSNREIAAQFRWAPRTIERKLQRIRTLWPRNERSICRNSVPAIVASIVSVYTDGMSTNSNQYKYLARKPKSVYKQLFIKDRWVSARTLYGMYVNEEMPMTSEEIAADYDLPLEAVLEAIAYCESNPPEIAQDLAREEALMEATGMNDPDYKYHPQPKVLTPQERARINRL